MSALVRVAAWEWYCDECGDGEEPFFLVSDAEKAAVKHDRTWHKGETDEA